MTPLGYELDISLFINQGGAASTISYSTRVHEIFAKCSDLIVSMDKAQSESSQNISACLAIALMVQNFG